MTRPLETALPFDNHRGTPMALTARFTGALHQTGVVDYAMFWDELSSFFPRELWTVDNTPMAAIDLDSTYDPFLQAAYALGSNPTMGVRLSTDAIRSSPAELLRKMMTLASSTEGPVAVAIGAGELRQTKPFGYRRSEGLKRLEDVLRLVRRLYDEPEPFTDRGNLWHFKNATLGTERPARRPEFWALGGGPLLLDIAARYADGVEAAIPQAISSPEAFAELVSMMRTKVEGYGRDPDAFGFGIWTLCICDDDEDVIERVLSNPLIKYLAGQFGRFDSQQWLKEGETPVMLDGWHYAVKWLPFEQPPEEIQRIVDQTSASMVRKSFQIGSSERLRELNQQYIDAGATFVGMMDITPLILGPEHAEGSLRRQCQIFAELKAAAANVTTPAAV